MIRKAPIIFVLLLTGAFTIRHGFADDDDEFAASALRAANDIEWAQMSVRIVDPEGDPIVGAKVRPCGLLAGNGNGLWDKNIYGSPQQTLTDETGKTDVAFPAWVKYGETRPVVGVTLSLSHPDFCTKRSLVNVPPKNAPIVSDVKLERGVRLRIAGVAPGSDRPLADCHVMLENRDTDGEEFVRNAEGWLQSIPIRQDRRWFRVIHTPPDGLVEFSRPRAWSPDDPASREVRVEVRPGVRVTGTISKDVAIPIERGYVVAWCGSPVRQEAGNNQPRVSPILWIDTVPIDKAGTFEFSSLPSGYLAQFYAFANDSISAQPTDEAYETCCKWFSDPNRQRNAFFRYGQILRLAGTQAQINIEMEPAGQVRVKCIDPVGRPLRRITISSWPNQYMVGSGSTVFCIRQSSLDHLRNAAKTDGPTDWSRESPFTVETNAEGEALLRNLPQGQQSLFAGNEIWMSNQETKVKSDPGKTTEVILKLRPSSEEHEEGFLGKTKRWLEKIVR